MDQYNSRPLLVHKTPNIGDIFILDLGKRLGHTGIIEKIEGAIIHTIEGIPMISEAVKVIRFTEEKEKPKRSKDFYDCKIHL